MAATATEAAAATLQTKASNAPKVCDKKLFKFKKYLFNSLQKESKEEKKRNKLKLIQFFARSLFKHIL